MTVSLTQPPSQTSQGQSSIAKIVLDAVIQRGCIEFCLCPGARNAPLVYPLVQASAPTIYYWPEERSAAFFALGRIKATGRPAAVVTTSGTAAAELLPAVMEAHYTGLPLILITADRPRSYRGTGAPQSAEQVGLYGCYAHEMLDLAEGDPCPLLQWSGRGPLHLNVCFDQPNDTICQSICLEAVQPPDQFETSPLHFSPDESFLEFLHTSRYPLVVVGALDPACREEAVRFLVHLRAPVYAEAISGIREDPRLAPLRIKRIEKIWELSSQHGYPIDGILRIGSIPTARLWRDLEYTGDRIAVYSVSEHPFSGLSGGTVNHTSLVPFFLWGQSLTVPHAYPHESWRKGDDTAYQALLDLFQEEPYAEASLIHALSKKIPKGSKVYLGNSLPIREWDQAAPYNCRSYQMAASRGMSGIDGQIATFLGFSTADQENWAVIGDLTALYDMAGPWIASQLPNISATVVVVNNGGGRIFARMFSHPAFQHSHQLSFGPLAQFWGWRYERWESIPELIAPSEGCRLIEIVPDNRATDRFWQRLKEI